MPARRQPERTLGRGTGGGARARIRTRGGHAGGSGGGGEGARPTAMSPACRSSSSSLSPSSPPPISPRPPYPRRAGPAPPRPWLPLVALPPVAALSVVVRGPEGAGATERCTRAGGGGRVPGSARAGGSRCWRRELCRIRTHKNMMKMKRKENFEGKFCFYVEMGPLALSATAAPVRPEMPYCGLLFCSAPYGLFPWNWAGCRGGPPPWP